MDGITKIWKDWFLAIKPCYEAYLRQHKRGKMQPAESEGFSKDGLEAWKRALEPPSRPVSSSAGDCSDASTPAEYNMCSRGGGGSSSSGGGSSAKKNLFSEHVFERAKKPQYLDYDTKDLGKRRETPITESELFFAFLRAWSRLFEEGMVPLMDLANNDHPPNVAELSGDEKRTRSCFRAAFGAQPAGIELRDDYGAKAKDTFWMFNQYGFAYDFDIHIPTLNAPKWDKVEKKYKKPDVGGPIVGPNAVLCRKYRGKAFEELDAFRDQNGVAGNLARFAERVCGARRKKVPEQKMIRAEL